MKRTARAWRRRYRCRSGRVVGFFQRRAVLAEFGFVPGRSVRSSNSIDPFWGAGFKFGFNDHLVVLRLEAERYDVSDTHLNTVTAGLELKF